MSKILRPYTIIPPALYVQRDADRQIQDIIQDMGRPGYVLVSRQMGKTNLLLNAKRRLESSDDLFLYIDLSNPFQDAKSCFENIIDTALEIQPERFEKAHSEIRSRRKNLLGVPPHKQHTNELRILLKHLPGKLVIILDEIDALTKTDYSDSIFAQIRSVYFSRVNFPELNSLTYILSGVVEPIEIIKDPKISPFNIGQKIYLNDFNQKEFEQFISNSQLSVDPSIEERIFYWANGNPRMTWDLCSEIESLAASKSISIEDIDKVVVETYLTNYDKPPVDNIRELVKNERDIRNAIIEIFYKKGKDISDKVKNRLYLAGIINLSSEGVEIKNQIIKESLNIDWIKSLEQEDKNQLQLAFEYFGSGDFARCIVAFEQFLEDNDFGTSEKATCYMYLGEAYYQERQFDKALHNIDKAEFDVDDQAKLFYKRLSLKSSILFNLGRSAECIDILKTIINSGRKDVQYAQALVNYGATLIDSRESEHLDEALDLFAGILENKGLDSEKLKPQFIQELKAIAHNYLGRIQTIKGNLREAKRNYEIALDLCKIDDVPPILLHLYDIVDQPEEQQLLLSRAVDVVVDNKLIADQSAFERPSSYRTSDLRRLIYLSFLSEPGVFDKLKSYALAGNILPVGSLVLEAILAMVHKSRNVDKLVPAAQKLYSDLKHGAIEYDDETMWNVVKFLAYVIDEASARAALVPEYGELFIKLERTRLDTIDIRLWEVLLKLQFDGGDYRLVVSHLERLKSILQNETDVKVLVHAFMLYNIELLSLEKIGAYERIPAVSKEISALASNPTLLEEGNSIFGDGNLKIIVSNAQILGGLQNRMATYIKGSPKFGRNDRVQVRYKSGYIKRDKYKNIEKDLMNGECVLV